MAWAFIKPMWKSEAMVKVEEKFFLAMATRA